MQVLEVQFELESIHRRVPQHRSTSTVCLTSVGGWRSRGFDF